MRPPRIAISMTFLPSPPETVGRDLAASAVGRAYVAAVLRAGGVPICLPNVALPGALDPLLELADGLLLTGGADFDPAWWGEANAFPGAHFHRDRDHCEVHAIRRAMAGGRPVLGICRGHQGLAVALGGALHQDLALRPGTGAHRAAPGSPPLVHPVTLEPGARLADIAGARRFEVNSTHHQLVRDDRLPAGLAVAARSDDGAVEAIEWQADERFAVGVQWHPEGLPDRPESERLFAAFAAAALSCAAR